MKDSIATINGQIQNQLPGPLDLLKRQLTIGIPAPVIGVLIIMTAVACYFDPLLCFEWLLVGFGLALWFTVSLLGVGFDKPQILTPHTISCGAASIQVVVYDRHGRTELMNVTRHLSVLLPAGVLIKRTPVRASFVWVDWRLILKDRFEPIR